MEMKLIRICVDSHHVYMGNAATATPFPAAAVVVKRRRKEQRGERVSLKNVEKRKRVFAFLLDQNGSERDVSKCHFFIRQLRKAVEDDEVDDDEEEEEETLCSKNEDGGS